MRVMILKRMVVPISRCLCPLSLGVTILRLPLQSLTRAPTKAQPLTFANSFRERKMRTKFFCTNFLNTARGPGHPGKIPGTSRIPLFETQGRQSFEGGHEVFGHHPFAWKTPTPPGGLRTQKLNLGRCPSTVRQVFPRVGLSTK